MVTGVPLIDLDRPALAPVEPPPRARFRPAVLVALIAVLLAPGGAAPPEPGLTPVLTISEPFVAFQPAAGSFFVATPDDVRRYDPPVGTPRWTRAFGRFVQDLRYDRRTGVLLVVSSHDPQLTALDAATGRVLWSENLPDSVVVSIFDGGVLTHSFGSGPARLRLADARTGRQVWARDVDTSAFLGPEELFGDGSSRVVAVGSSGVAVVLRWADGAELARGDVGLGPEAAGVSVVGERLYVSRRSAGRPTLTAYSLEPLARVWQAAGGPVGTVTDCGPVICVAGALGLSAVEPSDGTTRWTQPVWEVAYRYDAGRLFAYDYQEETQAALLDADTGEVVRPLGQSQQLGDLVLRAQGRQTLVLVPDGHGGLRTAGVTRDAAWFRCTARDGYLACPTLAGELRLWRAG